MLRSPVHLLANRAEALRHRRAELFRLEIELEDRLREESLRYDAQLASRRREGLLRAKDARTGTKIMRLKREAFRQALAVGFGFSLLVGLVALAVL